MGEKKAGVTCEGLFFDFIISYRRRSSFPSKNLGSEPPKCLGSGGVCIDTVTSLKSLVLVPKNSPFRGEGVRERFI